MSNVLVAITAILQVLIGLVVYQRNRKSLTNITFGFISLTTLGWAITNYISILNPTSSHNLQIIRLVLFFVVLQNTVFYIFAHNYPYDRQTIKTRKLLLFVVLSVLAAVATISPYVFTSVTISHNQSNPNPGPLIIIFMIHALYSIGSGLGSLIRKVRVFRGPQRKHTQYILFASILTWGVVPITNFVITLVFHTTFFAKVSPLYTLAFGAIIGYAIVAQRLFNIQAAVARSSAYVLTLVTLACAYVAGAFTVSSLFFGVHSVSMRVQIVYILLALVLATSFQPVKRTFDRATNKLFYQDAYDPQEFLNELNRVLVATVGLDELLNGTIRVIEQYLKIEFCLVAMSVPGSRSPNIVGLSKKSFSTEDLAKAYTRMSKAGAHGQVILTDYLESEDESLRQLLLKDDISVMAQLKNGSRSEGKEIGYVVMGPKKSGNPYNSLDVRVIETITNVLVIAIQNAMHYEEIQQFNITLQEKVDEETRKLRHSNDKLRTLDETKDEFISMASHQLRTPLTSVKGYVSMVLDGDVGEITPMQRKLLNQSFVSSQRMVYLIADLLNISRLRTGKFVIEPVPTDLAKVTQGEVAQLIETAKGRGLELSYRKPDQFPEYMLDETKLRQVIMNFADNAIYYTPSGGHIVVELKDKPQSIELTISDDGMGVPKSEQHHLFTKFYRAPNAKRARPDGTGLGLFMAKKVILAQGGSIIFNSSEGKGSTFGFAFAKKNLALAPDKHKKLGLKK